MEKPFFLEFGNGRNVIFIHGAGGSHINWLYVARKLASEGFKSIVLDLPGHHRTPLYDASSIEDYARAVSLLLEEKSTLVGHSMGGLVAYVLGAKHPELIDRVVLVNSGIFSRPKLRKLPTKEEICKKLFHRRKTIEDCMRRKLLIMDNLEALKRDFLFISRFNPYKYIDSFRKDCYHIIGTKDSIVPLEQLVHTSSLLSCKNYFMDNCGHMPMVEDPEEFMHILLDILR